MLTVRVTERMRRLLMIRSAFARTVRRRTRAACARAIRSWRGWAALAGEPALLLESTLRDAALASLVPLAIDLGALEKARKEVARRVRRIAFSHVCAVLPRNLNRWVHFHRPPPWPRTR